MGRYDYLLNPKKVRKKLEEERKQLEMEAANAAEGVKNLPKTFKFYCSSCLFQTNEESKRCPKCGDGVLRRTN
jgi:rubrerythrin